MKNNDVRITSVTIDKAMDKHSDQTSEIFHPGLTEHEMELFFDICYFVQNQNKEEVEIPFSELRSLLEIERRRDEKRNDEMQEIVFNFLKITITEKSDSKFYTIVPFYGFRLNTKTKTFAVQVHKDFVRALNYLDGTTGNRYTLADVKAIYRAKSVYSKHALKMMFYLRNTGYWYVSVENLRKSLDVPPGYKQGNITERVIEPIRQDCAELGIFDEFEIIENKDPSQSGKGRKKIISYTFKFKFKPDFLENENDPLKEDDSIKCPKCGKPLYRIELKDGSDFFYGHRGGHRKDAKCSYTTNPESNAIEGKFSIDECDRSDEPSVSKKDLESYYEYIRSEAQSDLQYRVERMRAEEPELWKLYEEREKSFSDYVAKLTTVRISDRTEMDNNTREQFERARVNLRDVLVSKGFEEGYFDIQYKCTKCRDTGILPDGSFCSCRIERAREAVELLQTRR